MTGADILVECLRRQGVGVVFGMPGSLTREIYAALYKQRHAVRHILARHEGGASLMADGYARVTNDVGVCLTIPGPGAANAYVGVLEAFTMNVPLLLITAQNYSRFGRKDPSKMVHGLDQLTAFGPVTKCRIRVESAQGIPDAVYEVFGALRSGRPRPALLEITRDALAENATLPIPERNDGTKTPAPGEKIERAIGLLEKSKQPFVLAGRGVYHAQASSELAEFVSLIQAPVATTKAGKGVIPEDHPLSLGDLQNPTAREALRHSDLVFAIGTRFTQPDTDSWSLPISQPLVRIDADPEEIDSEYVSTVGIPADPRMALQQLLTRLEGKEHQSAWGDNLETYKKGLKSRKGPRYIQELRHALPRDGILSVDIHVAGYEACTHFEVYDAARFLHSPISMTLGYALPAAIGAKIACPDSPVIAFCGDGGFLLSSPELATAAKYNLHIVVVVVNDNSFATIRDVQLRHFGHTIGVDLYNPDFVRFAESYGITGLRVSSIDDFAPALNKALSSEGPALIEVVPKRSLKGRGFHELKRISRRAEMLLRSKR